MADALCPAWAGAAIGDNTGFAIGRYAGRELMAHYGARVGLGAERLDKVEAVFKKYGPLTVAFARFVAFLRQLNGPVAGTLDMRWRRFLMFEAIGSAMWVAAWMLFGHYVGDNAATLLAFARKFWPAALVLAGLALIVAFVWLYRTRQRRG